MALIIKDINTISPEEAFEKLSTLTKRQGQVASRVWRWKMDKEIAAEHRKKQCPGCRHRGLREAVL